MDPIIKRLLETLGILLEEIAQITDADVAVAQACLAEKTISEDGHKVGRLNALEQRIYALINKEHMARQALKMGGEEIALSPGRIHGDINILWDLLHVKVMERLKINARMIYIKADFEVTCLSEDQGCENCPAKVICDQLNRRSIEDPDISLN